MQTYERIIKLMEYLNLNKNSFSEEIGMSSNVTIGRIINEKRNPNPTTLKKIVERFPQINYDWLKAGQGEMIMNEQKSENNSGIGIIGNNVNGGSINDHKIVLEMIELLRKKDEQIDRLISVIEKK
jgi:transcriptional regulator with XRE-family HTH domain